MAKQEKEEEKKQKLLPNKTVKATEMAETTEEEGGKKDSKQRRKRNRDCTWKIRGLNAEIKTRTREARATLEEKLDFRRSGEDKVMPAVVKVMKEKSTLVKRVNPRCEARRSQVLDRNINGVESFGCKSKGWIESPLKGAEGNTEFLVCFDRIADVAVEAT